MKKIEYHYTLSSYIAVNFNKAKRIVKVDSTGGTPEEKTTYKYTADGKWEVDKEESYTTAKEHNYATDYIQFETELITGGGDQERTLVITEMDREAVDTLSFKGEARHQLNTTDLDELKIGLTNAKYDLSGKNHQPKGIILFYIGTSDDRIMRADVYNHADYKVDSTAGPILHAPNTTNKFNVYFQL